MKSQATIQAALNKYKDEREKINHRLDITEQILNGDLETTNAKTMSFEDQKRILVFASEKQELKQQQKDMDFKIRFTEWILED